MKQDIAKASVKSGYLKTKPYRIIVTRLNVCKHLCTQMTYIKKGLQESKISSCLHPLRYFIAVLLGTLSLPISILISEAGSIHHRRREIEWAWEHVTLASGPAKIPARVEG